MMNDIPYTNAHFHVQEVTHPLHGQKGELFLSKSHHFLLDWVRKGMATRNIFFCTFLSISQQNAQAKWVILNKPRPFPFFAHEITLSKGAVNESNHAKSSKPLHIAWFSKNKGKNNQLSHLNSTSLLTQLRGSCTQLKSESIMSFLTTSTYLSG